MSPSEKYDEIKISNSTEVPFSFVCNLIGRLLKVQDDISDLDSYYCSIRQDENNETQVKVTVLEYDKYLEFLVEEDLSD